MRELLTSSHAKAFEVPTPESRGCATAPLMTPAVVKTERALYKNIYNKIIYKPFVKFYAIHLNSEEVELSCVCL